MNNYFYKTHCFRYEIMPSMLNCYYSNKSSFAFDSYIFSEFFSYYVKVSPLPTYENLKLKYKLIVKEMSVMQYNINPFFMRIDLTT